MKTTLETYSSAKNHPVIVFFICFLKLGSRGVHQT